MMNEDSKELCLERLDKTINNFLQGTCDDKDSNIIALLEKIIVVEKETATANILFNMLKENYFQSDSATINFVNKMYEFDTETLSSYMNIYLEQLYEGETKEEEIAEDLQEMFILLRQINPTLCDIFEHKRLSYKEHSRL